ncbi:MAG TPA: phenylalanine--tRNA ligase subunit alpha [Ignavibacteriaceae bacterium]|nr:phenylalanine--tRNA ligase subunit alpha [Ignavibacteriaceae bacterium]
MNERILSIKNSFITESASVSDPKALEILRIKYLSKNGLLPALLSDLKNVAKEDKPAIGKELNLLKNFVESSFKEIKERIDSAGSSSKETIDLSLPARALPLGSKHIITQTMEEITDIFKTLGFGVYEGPEIESDYYNFEALNFAPDHPARDMQDTFFINDTFLLRTHTTPVQIRIMEKQAPPVRAIMPGKVFRNEAVSTRSHYQFHQIDGIFVDHKVTFAELKGTLVAFAKQFYGSDIKFRFRASYFPFTEPSAEMDITCFICKGEGCRICKHSGWLEILGCGMVDPNVFKSVNLDPDVYSGYAFGMGIERIALLKYNITDIRIFFENDVRFLKQFPALK